MADYEAVIGKSRVDELKRLAEPLTGHGWVNVNSTAVGGGVAEKPFGRARRSSYPGWAASSDRLSTA